MTYLCWLIFFLGAISFWQAWRALRHATLAHALVWAASAWLAWAGVLLANQVAAGPALTAVRYLALCLVGCAGVAVLGARRPGVIAWDFVVLGLLAVFLLFLAEGFLVGGELQLGPVRTVFLAVTLAIGVANYLPTRLAAAALLLGLGSGCALWDLVQRSAGSDSPFHGSLYAELLILLAPPAASASCWLFPANTGSDADRLWRDFRDRFGLVWGLRLGEQFNRAAANTGLSVELGWSGLRAVPGGDAADPTARDAALLILRALLKRFVSQDGKETVAMAPATGHQPGPPAAAAPGH